MNEEVRLSFLKSSYKKVLNRLPAPIAGFVGDAVYTMRGRPFVYKDSQQHAFTPFARGSVTISIDFELAWAWRYTKSGRDPLAMASLERTQVPKLVKIFEDFSIPVTWATVGHLFLDHCVRGANGLAHPDLPRVGPFESTWWRFGSGDWFQHDPCSNHRDSPFWYGPDLIESILKSHVKHEIACHTFSHVGFASYCRREVATAELDACLDVMKPYGLRPKTLVFPGNDAGHLDVVAAKGFRTVRWFPIPTAEITLPMKTPEGLWGQHASLCLEAGDKAERIRKVRKLLNRLVERAAKTKMNAHIWFHPSICDSDVEHLLVPLLQTCAKMREQGTLDVLSMDELSTAMDAKTIKFDTSR